MLLISQLVERKESQNKYHDFFEQKENFDVLFLGNSHTINAVFPMKLWNDYGIVSYNLAGHGNRLPTTYAVLKEALKYTSPQLVVVDCFHIKSNRMYSDSIEQVHLSMDAFPLTLSKFESICNLIEEWNLRSEFLWPFTIYHNRWDSLTADDIHPTPSPEKGAEAKIGTSIPRETITISSSDKLTEDTVGIEYLRKIIELCQSQNIEVLLTFYPFPANEEEQREANFVYDIAKEYNLNYINFLKLNIVDYNTDCLDEANHLNASGGDKVSSYIGKYIVEHYSVPDRRSENSYDFWYDDYQKYLSFRNSLGG